MADLGELLGARSFSGVGRTADSARIPKRPRPTRRDPSDRRDVRVDFGENPLRRFGRSEASEIRLPARRLPRVEYQVPRVIRVVDY